MPLKRKTQKTNTSKTELLQKRVSSFSFLFISVCFPLDSLWLPFGSLWLPLADLFTFTDFSLHFGRPLAYLWLPFACFWHPFGTILGALWHQKDNLEHHQNITGTLPIYNPSITKTSSGHHQNIVKTSLEHH